MRLFSAAALKLNTRTNCSQNGRRVARETISSAVGIFLTILILSGCSATSPVVSEWRNPSYSAASFKRIMVSGPAGATSIRRNFEDEFVAELQSAGVSALASYRYMPEDQSVDEASVKQAAQKAGADGAIFARALNVEEKKQYGPNYYPTPWFGFFGPHIGAWYGPYWGPSVYRYNEYTSETTLYDVAKNQVVWSGTIKMIETSDIKAAIKTYVGAVIKALNEKNLLATRE